jgi:hypothetical protein
MEGFTIMCNKNTHTAQRSLSRTIERSMPLRATEPEVYMRNL